MDPTNYQLIHDLLDALRGVHRLDRHGPSPHVQLIRVKAYNQARHRALQHMPDQFYAFCIAFGIDPNASGSILAKVAP